jgi:hypothetical protein
MFFLSSRHSEGLNAGSPKSQWLFGVPCPEALSWAEALSLCEGEAKELSNWKISWVKKDEILRYRFAQGQNDRIKNPEWPLTVSPYFLLCHPYFSFVTLRRKPKSFLTYKLYLKAFFYLSPWGEAEGSPVKILRSLTRKRMRFFTPLVLRSEWRLFRHPEGFSPKGLLRRFFAFGSEWQKGGRRWCPEPKPWAYAKGLRRVSEGMTE